MHTGRTMAFVWSVTMGLVVAACGSDQPQSDASHQTPTPTERRDTTVSDVLNREIETLGDQATRLELLAIEEKRAFLEALERQINTLETQIETAGQQLAQVEEDADDVLARKRNELREQRIELVAQWRKLESAGADEWKEMKTALVDAWADTRQQADIFMTELRNAVDGKDS